MADLADLLFPEPGGVVWLAHGALRRRAALEVWLGRPDAPYDCPVCGERPMRWRLDVRGVLFDHGGRRYPCRVRER